MKLTSKEIKWLEGLQDYIDSAPSSINAKSSKGKLSSFTIGDNNVVIYDEEKCENYERLQRGPSDKGVCVTASGSELFELNFPFYVESTAG